MIPFAEDWKFRSIESACQILADQKLWFSTPEKFNDPFDCQVDSVATFDAIKDSLVLHHQADITGLVQSVQQHFREHRYAYLCTCAKWDETIMWSHYAKEHEGVALGFSFAMDSPLNVRELTYKPVRYCSDELKTAIRRCNDAYNYYRRYHRDPNLMEDEADYFIRAFQGSLLELYEAVRFMKAECWQPEHENRYEVELSAQQAEGTARPFAPIDLKHVIFGVKCPDCDLETIRGKLSTAEWKHVQCWRAMRDVVNLKLYAKPL